MACEQDFPLFLRQTRIGCRMFWSTETNVSCNNLSVVVTHEHVDSASSPSSL
jgi:hypothetical protein